jgi:hypothetical protein
MVLSSFAAAAAPAASRVVVTGAAGRTGLLVFKRLLDFPTQVTPIAAVKISSKSKGKLLKIVDHHLYIVLHFSNIESKTCVIWWDQLSLNQWKMLKLLSKIA